MDDPTETAFLRLQGQINATQILLAHLIPASAESLNAAERGMRAMTDVANAALGSENERVQIIGIGMEEAMRFITEQMGT